MLRVGILGLGRIGRVHLVNLSRMNDVEVVAVMTPSPSAKEFAQRFHVPQYTSHAEDILGHDNIHAVIIASPTDSHADYIRRAANSGKAIFCEKPLDLSVDKTRETLEIVRKTGTPLMLGFNQRFDPDFSEISNKVSQGDIGIIRTVHIVSRDPHPPPLNYIKQSGGLFFDMTIHDFDMSRFLINAPPVNVYAKGFNVIDPEIGKAGDIDLGIVIITFANQATAIIENSRHAAYGYDQRLEVFGSLGMIRAENPLKTNIRYFDASGGHLPRHADFFMDRYAASYRLEMQAFIDALQYKTTIPVTGEDGLEAMLMADAAKQSLKNGTAVTMKR